MKIGSLVELVDDNWPDSIEPGDAYPVKGVIYTVRDIIDNTSIRLEEVVNAMEFLEDNEGRIVYDEICFIIKRFRELLPPINLEKELNQTISI